MLQVISDQQDKINQKKNILSKIKENSIKMMIIENKKLPQIWSSNKNIKTIINKVYQNEELKKLSCDNKKNNKLLQEYNEKLKIEENKNKKKINIYEYNFGFDRNLVSHLISQRQQKYLNKKNIKTERNSLDKNNDKDKDKIKIKINKIKLTKNLSCADLINNKIKKKFNKKLKISNSSGKLMALQDKNRCGKKLIQSYICKKDCNDNLNCNKNNSIYLNKERNNNKSLNSNEKALII